MTDLTEFIRKTLPSLKAEEVRQLADHLATKGFTTEEDRGKIKAEHVNGHLKKLAVFKFLEACHKC